MFKVHVPVIPMAPTLVRPPFHRDGWIYEEKCDGWRMVAYRDGSRVRLISRRGVEWTARFPELAAAIGKLRSDVLVLDGEVVVFDAKLVSRCDLLGEEHPTELCTPPIFMAFDVLQAGNRDVRGYTLEYPDRYRRAVEAVTAADPPPRGPDLSHV